MSPVPDKSTRVQRKHSFEVNVDFVYIIPLFQFSRAVVHPCVFQKSRYGSSPKKRFDLTNSVSNHLVTLAIDHTCMVCLAHHHRHHHLSSSSLINIIIRIIVLRWVRSVPWRTWWPRSLLSCVQHTTKLSNWDSSMVTGIVNCDDGHGHCELWM